MNYVSCIYGEEKEGGSPKHLPQMHPTKKRKRKGKGKKIRLSFKPAHVINLAESGSVKST